MLPGRPRPPQPESRAQMQAERPASAGFSRSTRGAFRPSKEPSETGGKMPGAALIGSGQPDESVILLDDVAHRPLVAKLLGLLERRLQHLGGGQAGCVELLGLLLRPVLERARPFDAHGVVDLVDDSTELL